MSEEKTKVVLLGVDNNLLKNVSERVNETRPAAVVFFTDLKDFLEYTIENKPDLVGLSVGYPHKSTDKFPKVFKMALNVPVLTFGENQNFKTRKQLSASKADLKISGVITAHNLWMKILNLQKMQEDAHKIDKSEKDGGKDSDQNKNSVFLKGGPDPKVKGNKNSLLNNLFAALDNGGKMPEETNMNMVSLGDSIKNQKQNLNQLNLDNNKGTPVGGNISHMGGTADSSEIKSGGMNNVSNSEAAGDQTQSKMNHISGTVKSNANSLAPRKDMGDPQALKNDDVKEENISSSKAGKELNKAEGKKKNLEFAMGGIDKGPENKKNTKDKNPAAVKELDDAYKGKLPKKENSEKKDEDQENREEPGSQPQPQDEKSEGNPFGKVQLSDEKEVKEQAEKKSKDKIAQENLKKKNILRVASEAALEKHYVAQSIMEAREFDVTKLAVFTVNMGSFMGYLTVSNSFNHDYSLQELEGFREILIKNLQDQGAFGELSLPYLLEVDVKAYDQVIPQFTEFNITHEDESGKQHNVAFVTREVLTPTFSDSDKKDMFLVDIKVIPPQTPVNFDAFIYLPRNKRFVRYLKDGRSLSLKQAKRHSEETDGQSKLYLPKDHKRKFEQFFIQNTLNWEFSLHAKREDAA